MVYLVKMVNLVNKVYLVNTIYLVNRVYTANIVYHVNKKYIANMVYPVHMVNLVYWLPCKSSHSCKCNFFQKLRKNLKIFEILIFKYIGWKKLNSKLMNTVFWKKYTTRLDLFNNNRNYNFMNKTKGNHWFITMSLHLMQRHDRPSFGLSILSF